MTGYKKKFYDNKIYCYKNEKGEIKQYSGRTLNTVAEGGDFLLNELIPDLIIACSIGLIYGIIHVLIFGG